MKKNVLAIIMSGLIAILMCGCDNNRAVAEVYSESGYAGVFLSYNDDSGYTISAQEMAIRKSQILELPKGDKVSIHFYCNVCNHDELVEIDKTSANLFECDCPIEGDENGNRKEFFSIIVKIGESEVKTEE